MASCRFSLGISALSQLPHLKALSCRALFISCVPPSQALWPSLYHSLCSQMGSLIWREKREGRRHLNLEAFQHLEVRKKGRNQHQKLKRSSQGMSKRKTLRKGATWKPRGENFQGQHCHMLLRWSKMRPRWELTEFYLGF